MKRWIVIAFLVLAYSLRIQAQTAEDCLAAGLKAYSAGSMNTAIDLIERAMWFDPNLRSLESDLTLSAAYGKLFEYQKASMVLDNRLTHANLSDSSRIELLIQYASVALVNDRLPELKYWMLQADTTYSDLQEQNLALMKGGAYFLNGEFYQARTYFTRLDGLQSITRRQDLDGIISRTEAYYKKKPITAMLLSALLPGLGQLYAREPRESLNSFLLNAGTLSLYILTLSNFGYVEATVLVYPWFIRYYKGGFDRSRELVKKRKKKAVIDGLERILDLNP